MDPTHQARADYLGSKRSFRQALRTLRKEQDMAFYEELDLQCSDSFKLFCLLRHRMGTHCDLSKKIIVDGVEYAGEEIPEGWAKHFEALGTPEMTGFDAPFQDQVRKDLAAMETASGEQEDTLLVSITKAEVTAAIKSLSLQ